MELTDIDRKVIHFIEKGTEGNLDNYVYESVLKLEKNGILDWSTTIGWVITEKYRKYIRNEKINKLLNMNIEENIGKKVKKVSKKNKEPKPFKSGNKINTIKGIINHPILNIPAYTFEEDDSYVEVRRCEILK